jgi:2',3'-cyclic-nucleotide 2'-phosphodiesterase (5'-nucleotidase family)
MIEIMNHLGIEYVVLGNHEFDFGCEVLRERMKESKFKYLGSNVRENPSGKLMDGVIDTEIVPLKGGLKLGIFGVCTDETPQLSYPGEDVMFDDVFKTSKCCVEQLKAQGADFILALTHLPIEDDKLLARRVKGIDVILGGHDHEPFTLYEGNTFIHKSGQNAMWLGKLEFSLSKKNKHPLAVTTQWSMIATQDIAPDVACQKIVHKYMQLLEADHNSGDNARVLAVLEQPLSTRTAALRAGESNMGNLVADALCCELNADYGLVNGGFIRGDKLYDAGTNMTAGMINQEMPFPNPTAVVRIQLRDFGTAILEHMAKYPHMSGSHPHISGLRLTVDWRTQPPSVVEMVDDMGREVDPDEWVLVGTTKFIAQGGDGCKSWQRGEVVRVGDSVAVIVADFMEKKRVVAYPEHEGRITIIE